MASVDAGSVRQIPGLVKVVVLKNFVGVVADKQSQALKAARQLKVAWNSGPGLPAQTTFYDSLRKQPSRDVLIVDSKDVEQQLTKASTVVRATYLYPYQMHGSLGTSCAVADVESDRATVWSATQSVYPTRSIVAQLLGVPLEGVCLYPILDRFDWEDSHHWHNSGLWDMRLDTEGHYIRTLNPTYFAALTRAQNRELRQGVCPVEPAVAGAARRLL